MLTSVRLYGHLGDHFGRDPMTFDVATPAEIFAALRSQLDGFKAYLIEHSDPGYLVVLDGKPQRYEDLQLLLPDGDTPLEVKIVPAVRGAGDGKGIGMIIGGVLLAIVSFGVGAAVSAGAIGAGWGIAASVGASVGLGMTSMGVSQLISPQPSTPAVAEREAERKRQYKFDSLSPTIQQGVPIPIRYGRQCVEGYPVSIRMSVVNDVS